MVFNKYKCFSPRHCPGSHILPSGNIPSGNIGMNFVHTRWSDWWSDSSPGGLALTIKVLGRGFHAKHLGAHKAPKKARFLAYWDAWALAWDGVRQSGKALKTRPEQDAKRGSSGGQQGQGVQRPVRMHAHAVSKV